MWHSPLDDNAECIWKTLEDHPFNNKASRSSSTTPLADHHWQQRWQITANDAADWLQPVAGRTLPTMPLVDCHQWRYLDAAGRSPPTTTLTYHRQWRQWLVRACRWHIIANDAAGRSSLMTPSQRRRQITANNATGRSPPMTTMADHQQRRH